MSQLTLLYNHQTRGLSAREDDGAPWVSASALSELTGFEFKPEGACYGEVCIPLPAVNGKAIQANGEVNLPAVAARLGQAMVHDAQANVISLGPIPEVRQRFAEGQAPDFDIPDREGKPVKLSMFKDKKVILMTWASW
jgi:hypothetical protein